MDFLLDNFKHLTTTPKNVEQLKKLVLQLAVQGKLTTQWRKENPDVKPAIVLLEKIKAEKEQLIKDGKLKREKPLQRISENEKPFQIPESWLWQRLGDCAKDFDYGTSSKSKKEGKVPVLRMGNIQNGSIDWNKLVYSDDDSENIDYELTFNDLLFNRTNSRELVGKTALFTSDKKAIFAGYLVRFHLLGGIYPIYSNYVMNSPLHREWCNDVKIDAIGQSNINATKLRSFLFPLPPLTEQQAIVSKVESLFAQIDQLYELAKKKVALKVNASKALFGKVNTASDAADLMEIWQLLNSNFSGVTQSKEGVKQLRQTILQLALQGKFTVNWRKEKTDVEPVIDLLKKIKSEKEQLIKDGKLSKKLPLSKISENEKPYQIPESWVWIKLGEIGQHNSGKTLDSGRNKGNPQNYITTSNLYWGFFNLNNLKTFLISESELERCTATKGDLLICEGGEAGRTAVWEEPYNICFQNHIHRVRLFGNINPYFVFRYFQKLNFTGEINAYRKGMGISNMSSSSLSSILIPIPPIVEQELIVSIINQLMALCDELEKKIEKRDTYQERIMQAVVKQAI